MKRPTMEMVRAANRELKAVFIAQNKNGNLPPELLMSIDILDWVTNGSPSRTLQGLSEWMKNIEQ